MPVSYRYLLSGAGSRKTTRLCGRALAYLRFPGTQAQPEDLLLTTFSREAANQLLDRLRLKILRAPGLDWSKKQELLDGLDRATINTNHAIGLAAFRDHWIELEHPPAIQVINDEARRPLVFEAMQSAALPAVKRQELERRAVRLGRSDGQYRSRNQPKGTVSSDVSKLVDIKERSGLSDFDFVRECVASIDAILSVLAGQRKAKGVTGSMADVEAAALAVEPAIAADVPHYPGGKTSITKSAHKDITDFLRQRTWSDVLPLAALNAHKKSNRSGEPAPHDRLDPLRRAAVDFHLFADFEDDVRRYVELAAELAAASHAEYQSLLRRSGRIDYMAMERALAHLSTMARPWASFCGSFGFVGIDEAQDMTPEWTGIFLALTQQVECGLWIADPNQSIHGFRGADHKAVNAAAQALCAGIRGGRVIPNDVNFRSTRGIVGFVNHFFTFLRDPTNRTATRLPAQHVQQMAPEAPASTGRIERWQLGTTNQDQGVAKVAGEVRRLVKVEGHDEHDICVMLRTNANVRKMAAALKEVGLEVAAPPTDLLARREALVIVAALQLLIDPSDALASARLHILLDGAHAPPGQPPAAGLEDWLVERLLDQMKKRGTTPPAPGMPVKTVPRWLEAIKAAAVEGAASTMSPVSAVLLVIEATGLVSRVALWGEPLLRQSHIDAMIRMARGFEEAGIATGCPATVAAFAASCAERAEKALQRKNRSDEEDDDYDDRPIPADVPGVRVMTYHATKGLGFPVTVLADFGVSNAIDDPFEIRLVQKKPHVWPNPLGLTKSSCQPLESIAKSHGISQLRSDERLEGLAQLLYVAMTRAKGLLVFAHGAKDGDTEWFARILGRVVTSSPTPAGKPARATKAAAKKSARGKKKDDADPGDPPAGSTVSAAATGSTPVPVGSPPSPVSIDMFLPPTTAVTAVPVAIGGGAGVGAVGQADYAYRDLGVPPTPTPAPVPGPAATPAPAGAGIVGSTTYMDPQPASAAWAAGLPPPPMIEVIVGSDIRLLGDVNHGPRYESPSGNLHAMGSWRVASPQIDLPGAADLVTGRLRGAAGEVSGPLGDAFHAFMAAVPSLPVLPAGEPVWLRVAQRCLDGHVDAERQKVIAEEGVDAKVFVKRAAEFARWVRDEFGVEPEGWIVEAQVAGPSSAPAAAGSPAPVAQTMWRGRVDMVVVAQKGVFADRRVLIDHKAVLTDRSGCVKKTEQAFLGEVSAYADAMGSDAPAAIFVHFVLAGSVVPIQRT